MEIQDVQASEDLQKILETSHLKPVLLFKHSTACPLSARAWRQYSSFAATTSASEFWRVLVIENRGISLDIADTLRIRHQSPQVILFHKGQPVWYESHWGIDGRALEDALATVS